MFENTKLAWKISKEKAEKFLVDRYGQTMPGSNMIPVAVSLVAMLIVGYVGITILQSTTDSTALVSGDKLYSAQQNLIDITGTTFSMYGILIIVLLSSIIITLLLTSFIRGGNAE
jgi:hypothetical protein